jgi:hypothetical protein
MYCPPETIKLPRLQMDVGEFFGTNAPAVRRSTKKEHHEESE